ncbi:MAG TPA: BadF/BadG/BcrA/BcrD ATPase family protein [Streptosporangiaceae bacterium]|nr:BadF/BadG/BcrA/BcrD ATPase family protein [Streptosporangiaceae bacterium]
MTEPEPLSLLTATARDGQPPEARSGPRLLGLDIGGTLSRARLTVGGQVVADSQAPSASLPAAGRDRATSALTALLARLPLDPADPLDAVCAGSAGLSVPGARQFLHDQLAPLAPPGAVVIVSDAMLVLPAAGLDAGVAVICGTGSVAVGSWQGRTVQAGGWGYLLGDEGGGYWIVREALRALLGRRDRGQPAGELGELLLAATDLADVPALQRQFYAQPHFPREWARHARLVLQSPDPVAADIVARGAHVVGRLAAAALEQLGGPAGLPVVLAGGLLGDAGFRRAACEAVTHQAPAGSVSVLADDPVAGALRLAGQAAEVRS